MGGSIDDKGHYVAAAATLQQTVTEQQQLATWFDEEAEFSAAGGEIDTHVNADVGLHPTMANGVAASTKRLCSKDLFPRVVDDEVDRLRMLEEKDATSASRLNSCNQDRPMQGTP